MWVVLVPNEMFMSAWTESSLSRQFDPSYSFKKGRSLCDKGASSGGWGFVLVVSLVLVLVLWGLGYFCLSGRKCQLTSVS